MGDFRIGDLISLDGRTFSVRGFDPMSLPKRTVELVDAATGELVRLPVARLAAANTVSTRSAASKRPQRARRQRL